MISHDEMKAMKEKAGEKPGKSLIEMASEAKALLAQLADGIEKSGKASSEEKSQLSQIIESYSDLLENKLGQEPSEEPEEEVDETQTKLVSSMAGPKGVPMSHNFKKG